MSPCGGAFPTTYAGIRMAIGISWYSYSAVRTTHVCQRVQLPMSVWVCNLCCVNLGGWVGGMNVWSGFAHSSRLPCHPTGPGGIYPPCAPPSCHAIGPYANPLPFLPSDWSKAWGGGAGRGVPSRRTFVVDFCREERGSHHHTRLAYAITTSQRTTVPR